MNKREFGGRSLSNLTHLPASVREPVSLHLSNRFFCSDARMRHSVLSQWRPWCSAARWYKLDKKVFHRLKTQSTIVVLTAAISRKFVFIKMDINLHCKLPNILLVIVFASATAATNDTDALVAQVHPRVSHFVFEIPFNLKVKNFSTNRQSFICISREPFNPKLLMN